MTLIQTLADFTSGLSADRLPPPVVERGKLCLLDYVGVALQADRYGTASTRRGAQELLGVLRAEGASGDSIVLGRSERLTPSNAVLLNSYLGQSTSLDDTAVRSMAHVGCAVVPTILAFAGPEKADGREMIAAIVAGYEAMIRVGRVVMPGLAKRGFHVTALTAPYGAAAAAARLMKLDATKTAAALGIAGNLGAGLQEALFRSYAAGKFAVGRSAQAGVLGALLAREGMAGAPAFLEGPEGFLRAMSDEVFPHLLPERLGEEYEIGDIGFKFHSGCRHWHAAVDAIEDIRHERPFGPDDVEAIHVETYGEALRMNIDHPGGGDEARLCTPFAIAQSLLGERIIAGDVFSDEQLRREDVRALMDRVTHSLNPDFEKRYPLDWPVAVAITLRDGDVLSAERDRPRGEPGNTPAAAIIAKFVDMAGGMLGEERTQAALGFVRGLEDAENIDPLLAVLAEPSPGRRDAA
ncbi:MAG: MmgE/PrpD family protein [Microvirga sp.]|nr:MmgE/PrpD family protein [Microvirga sp.]